MNSRYVLFLSLIAMTGCATVSPQKVNSLESRLALAESEINRLNNEVESLKAAESDAPPKTYHSQSKPQAPAQRTTLQSEKMNVEGLSYGGVLRAQPDVESPKIMSLAQGQKFTIIERAAKVKNGYRWFKVKLPSGEVGYQWGGILCSFSEESIGAFRLCSAE